MAGENPFAEPHDSDRTVFIPVPGGRRPGAPSPAAPAVEATSGEAAPLAGPDTLATGASPLLAAASPLLTLLARLGRAARVPDGGELRERAAADLRRFEQAAHAAGIAMEQLRPAHYALAASLDDVALATPWGAGSGWAARSLVSTFHQQVRSGEGFFAVLRQVMQAPAANLPVLELMYICLSLGFKGQYRLSPRGPAELERVREELYTLILRQRPAAEPGLSPRWQGADAPYRQRRGALPVWVAAMAAFAAIAALFAAVLIGLGRGSDQVFEGLVSAPPATMPAIERTRSVTPPPPPAEPGALDRLRTFLAPEIAQHLVSVVGTEAVPVVRVFGAGMFASASAAVEPRFTALLGRIGAALREERGPVTVAGYTDNQPIRSLRFPSNFELSAARAAAAAAVLAPPVGDPSRLTAEGRGAADPIAPNSTAAGRERNRRIEIILHRRG